METFRDGAMPRLSILLLRGYKRAISPLLGARCRYHPSCSDYARVAVARFGLWRGLWLGTWRIVRSTLPSARAGGGDLSGDGEACATPGGGCIRDTYTGTVRR